MGGVIDWVDENFENIDWSPTEPYSILWSLFVKNVGAQNEGLVRKAWDRCVEDRKGKGSKFKSLQRSSRGFDCIS
ncbi:hypothetical protein TrRE_jg728, partial [Triparma retinervis]